MAEIGKDIQEAARLLEAGELVAIPTETVYGLAGNALQPKAIANIFAVKNRPQFDPLIVHVASWRDAVQFATHVPQQAVVLAQKFWPGPLTLLLPKKEIIPDLVTSGLDSVGLRCPNHAMTLQLLQQLSFPLAAPSANPFGYVSPTTPEHVQEQLGNKIAYILDGGNCVVGIESTIVGFEEDKTVIYRLGGLALEYIEKEIGKAHASLHSTSNPKAPGQLQSHYAPRKKVLLGDIDGLLFRFRGNHVGVLSFQKDYRQPFQVILSPKGNLDEAAQHLFGALRTLDKMPIEFILAELVPDAGIGRAINDRLKRAAAQ
jgi:L-threonylcarbamoyladenylate synthase